MLGLQFIGRLLVGLPSEKKGSKFFNISVGRPKSLSEGHKKISLDTQPIFSIISDSLFKFPQTDVLCDTLFDVLLGGASPKQVAYNSALYFVRMLANYYTHVFCGWSLIGVCVLHDLQQIYFICRFCGSITNPIDRKTAGIILSSSFLKFYLSFSDICQVVKIALRE